MADPVLIHAGNAAKAGRKYGIDPAVILGILSVEGGTNPDGSPKAPADGAGPASYGQFTFGTGRALGVHYGNSASETDAIGRYLNQLGYQKDPQRAIAAYNGGPSNPQYGYAKKVLAAAGRYKGVGGTSAPSTSGSSSGSGQLFGSSERSGALKALVWVAFVGVGASIAGLGLSRVVGVRNPAALAAAKGKAA